MRRVEHFAVCCPALHRRGVALECQTDRRTAAKRHDVNLGGAFIAGGKRDPLPIRRHGGIGFCCEIAGQTLRHTAGETGTPEIAFGDEDDTVIEDRRLSVVARRHVGSGDSGGQGKHEKRH